MQINIAGECLCMYLKVILEDKPFDFSYSEIAAAMALFHRGMVVAMDQDQLVSVA